MREVEKSFWDTVTIIGTSIISIPVMIISESMQARLLGPGAYGKVALIYSTMNLLYLMGNGWLQTSVMRFGKEEFINRNNIKKTIGNILILTFGSFLISSSLFIIFKTVIFDFLEIKHPFALWIILGGYFIIIGKQIVLEILKVVRLIKIQAFLNRFALKVLILSGFIILYVIKSGLSVDYVILIFILADLLILLVGLRFIKRHYIFPFQYESSLLTKILKYTAPLIISSWSTFVVNWVDTYVIKYFMTLQDVGYYQAAYKLLNTVKSFFGTTIITIITPIILVLKTNNKLSTIKKIYLNRIMPQLSLISMLVVVLIIMSGDYIISFIYGPEFNEAILPFKILISAELFLIITAVLTPIMTSFDMTRSILFVGIGVGIFKLIADIILVQHFGITGVSIASLLAVMFGAVVRFYIVKTKFQSVSFVTWIFPFLTIVIMLINIFMVGIEIRLAATLLLLFLLILFVKKKSVFHESDLEHFENINMPVIVRKILTYIYQTLQTKN